MNRKDLRNYISNKEWIEDQMNLYKEQKQIAEGLRSPVIDGMPKAKNKPNYAIEELIDEYNKIIRFLINLQKEQNKITIQLFKMKNTTYRNILNKHYIQGKSLVRVADEMGYSYERIKHMNGIALDEFDAEGENI